MSNTDITVGNIITHNSSLQMTSAASEKNRTLSELLDDSNEHSETLPMLEPIKIYSPEDACDDELDDDPLDNSDDEIIEAEVDNDQLYQRKAPVPPSRTRPPLPSHKPKSFLSDQDPILVVKQFSSTLGAKPALPEPHPDRLSLCKEAFSSPHEGEVLSPTVNKPERPKAVGNGDKFSLESPSNKRKLPSNRPARPANYDGERSRDVSPVGTRTLSPSRPPAPSKSNGSLSDVVSKRVDDTRRLPKPDRPPPPSVVRPADREKEDKQIGQVKEIEPASSRKRLGTMKGNRKQQVLIF